MSDYFPHFYDTNENKFDVLEMHFCIDFGGRQCQIEAQLNNGDGNYPTKTFVIYYKTNDFTQWDSKEELDSTPVKDKFFNAVIALFKAFDEANQ